MKNIVVISGAFGRKMSPESSSIEKYLREIAKECNVYVVCPKANGNSDSEYEGIHICQVSNYWNSLRAISEKKLERGNRVFWKIILNAIRLHGYILSFLVFPTRNKWLIRAYGHALTKLSRDIKIDALISMGGLPCAHYAALMFKKDNPGIKWITYTLDPVTINDDAYEHVLFKRKRRCRYHQMELMFWENADWNLFTEELFSPMKEEFGDIKNNYICFPYVLNKPEIEYEYKSSQRTYLRAVYAGALYQNIRNPKRMLEVMSKVKGVRMELYTSGECDGIIREYESDNVQLMGLIPRNEYLKLIYHETDILVNIANSMTLMAPSKFFELLSTGLPIINFYTLQNTNYEMTERYPLGINIGANEENAVEKVQDFCNSVSGKRLSFDEVEKIYPEHSFNKQLEIIRKCLDLDKR